MATRRVEFTLVTKADLDPSSPLSGAIRAAFDLAFVWGSGTADNKVNAGPYRASVSIATASNTDIDLKSVTDPEGTAIDADEFAYLSVYNPPSNDGDLTIKPSSSSGWPFLAGTTPAYAIPPGGLFLITSPQAGEGVAIGASTDNINLANGGTGTVIAEVLFVGRT